MADEPEDHPRPEVEEEEEGGPVKSFLEHLEDLRWVLIKSGTALGIAMAGCMAAAPQLIGILQWPLVRSGIGVDLDFLNPLGGFISAMKIALYGGLTVALPFILYFIGDFVLPALKKHEKKYFLGAFYVGSGLFFSGILLCYFVLLPIALKGTSQFNQWLGVTTTLWRAEDYFSFVTMFMIGMGLSFEVPVVLLTLVKLEVIPHEWLIKGRKYFFVGNLTLCAFITPDFFSTFFMVIPVQLLMEICILISKHWERQKRAAEAALAAASRKQISSAD